MEITGHSLSLQPKHPVALTFRISSELHKALLEAHKHGTPLKFRAEAGAPQGSVKVRFAMLFT